MTDDVKFGPAADGFGTIEFAIVVDVRPCDCDACRAFEAWFDSDDVGDPPAPCDRRVIAAVDLRNRKGES